MNEYLDPNHFYFCALIWTNDKEKWNENNENKKGTNNYNIYLSHV